MILQILHRVLLVHKAHLLTYQWPEKYVSKVIVQLQTVNLCIVLYIHSVLPPPFVNLCFCTNRCIFFKI